MLVKYEEITFSRGGPQLRTQLRTYPILAQFAEILPPQSFSQRYLQKHLAYFKIKKIFTSLAWGGVEMGVPTTPSGWFKYHKTTARTLLRTRALF